MNIVPRSYYFLFIYALSLLIGCSSGKDRKRGGIDHEKFNSYWYQGKAEINSYDLQQYRYGEKRDGEAVLIFVTEDLSRSAHVKLDDPENAGRDAIKVLKLNKTKNFITGIYPYSMMLSVFTPVYESLSSLKLTASSQEWCGHTFTQLNSNGAIYRGRLFSYFQQEGDQTFSVSAMPEDDLWTLIRLDPQAIPTGETALIPGLLYQRLVHTPVQAEMAEITMTTKAGGLQELKVEYVDLNRTLKIIFREKFPYEILKWEEIQTIDGEGEEVTVATRKEVKLIDYWTKNTNEDIKLREELKLK